MQSENGLQTMTLMDVLNSINLETFNGCSGVIDDLKYDISKVADNVWLVMANTGTWQQQVHDNIKRMEQLMYKTNADSIDLNTSVPYAGVGYTLHIEVTKVKPAPIQLPAPSDTVNVARGRKSRGI